MDKLFVVQKLNVKKLLISRVWWLYPILWRKPFRRMCGNDLAIRHSVGVICRHQTPLTQSLDSEVVYYEVCSIKPLENQGKVLFAIMTPNNQRGQEN